MKQKLIAEVKTDQLKIFFTAAGGGLPGKVILTEQDGNEVVLLDEAQSLEAELADGRRIRPLVPEEEGIPLVYERGGVTSVEFSKLPWTDSDGRIIPDFYLSLRHEFMSDGTAFSTAFFYVEQNTPPAIQRFELALPLNLSAYEDVRWSICYRPKADDGPLIQSVFPERFLKRGEDRILENGIFPCAGFCARNVNAPSLYAEFFMEGDNAVSGKCCDNSSRVTWNNGSPTLKWNFQKVPTEQRSLPHQWRNRWGWVLGAPPVKRHLPPLRMYHYFDLAQHYPCAAQVEAMADAGCDILVFHENWRLDVQNDGMPYDIVKFRNLIRQAHQHGIRVAVYIRGNEVSVHEDNCDWFNRYLQHGYDGLYMDYGSPFGESTPPDETYQNGRILFREHYLKLKRLRATIGKDGIFYSHTGPLFSAVGMSFMDGYVSGEGERGILVKGRAEHEYFSMSYACLGTMWTAAFPEYSSPLMIPFLAAAGQYPHNPLGTQFPTSSLAHPPEPGINDGAFLPLWKLWSCFRKEQNIAVFNDFNCRRIFADSGKTTGHYLMVSSDGKRGLLVLSNFSSQAETVSVTLNRNAAGLLAEQAFLLPPDGILSGKVQAYHGTSCDVTLPGFGVASFLFCDSETERKEMLSEYLRPCHQVGELGEKWIAEVECQRKMREQPPAWNRVFLTVDMPFGTSLAYEDSLIIDLFNITMELGVFEADGTFRHLCWIGHDGVLKEEPEEGGKRLHSGETAHPIALHEFLPKGTHRLGIRSYHLGEPFYSFITATLSSGADGKDGYQLVFRNELEKDRAFLTWTTVLS